MTEVDWSRLKAQELRARAERNAVVILPVASIEQHGPHLPVMTDTRLGHEIALRAARIAYPTRPTVVAPVVWSGLSEHHMAFGGTLSVSADTFRALLVDLIECLIRLGFHDILISNSHGGNINTMKATIDEIAPGLPATLVGTTYVDEAGAEIGGLLEDQTGISHACEAETSMMLAIEAALVDTGDLAALGQGNDGNITGTGIASHRWRPMQDRTPTGVTGNPTRATAEKGAALLDAAASGIARLIVDPQTWAPLEDRRL
ncbi:MAG: creatininase family protein [Paracoccaceae bacterium]